jgi:hypothetical protein
MLHRHDSGARHLRAKLQLPRFGWRSLGLVFGGLLTAKLQTSDVAFQSGHLEVENESHGFSHHVAVRCATLANVDCMG